MSLTKVSAGVLNIDDLYGFRNRIINGDMRIDQRNAGAAVTVTSATQVYTVDRWAARGQATDGVFTVQQSADVPAGFNSSLKVTVTTNDASIGSTQSYYLEQRIEGFNVADLDWGLASARTITLSFWVRSSVTGTFSGSLNATGGARSYVFEYSILAANTFEYKTVTIHGDTTGTWNKTNGRGIDCVWSLGVGSSLKGLTNSWTAGALYAATGSVDLISTSEATWYITGVQLEVGSVATPFERRPYGTELGLCQRYFQSYNGNTTVNLNDGSLINLPNWSTTEAIGAFVFPTMRTSPTLSFSALSGFRYFTAGSVFTPGSIQTNGANVNRLEIYITPSTGSWTAGNCGFFRIHTSSDYLRLSAEL